MGILPGTGAATAAFLKLRRGPPLLAPAREYRQGEPDGIIAAESSNQRRHGRALVPAGLGIPGDPVTAIMLATLTIHGVTPACA